RRQSVDDHRCAAAGDGDVVVAGGTVDLHDVGGAVALAASRRRGQVEGDLLDVGPGQVVDRDGVGTAQGVDLDALAAFEAHDDGAAVAGQPRSLAVGGDVHVLIDVAAIEHERVRARLALDRVAAITRIPDERVVAVAEQGRVVAAAAGHNVVA